MVGYLLLTVGLISMLFFNSMELASKNPYLHNSEAIQPNAQLEKLFNEIDLTKIRSDIKLGEGIYEKVAQILLMKRAEDAVAFHASLRHVYGDSYDYRVGEHVRKLFVQGDFSWMPTVYVVPQSVMPNAGAAYSERYNQIYLSNVATDSLVRSILYLEEIGHFLDTKLSSCNGLINPETFLAL